MCVCVSREKESLFKNIYITDQAGFSEPSPPHHLFQTTLKSNAGPGLPTASVSFGSTFNATAFNPYYIFKKNNKKKHHKNPGFELALAGKDSND